MSYTIEVYRGKQVPERNLGIFALYVMFFPQLVAGPIERPQNLLHQFREKHHFDYVAVSSGVKLIVWGLFQKMVIADRLAPIVDRIYARPSDFSGLTLALATVLFAFQIFCDFAGYSDIAIGTAQVLGFRLMTNFRQPYLSKSVAEFWKRWHISLSSWFRDYLYLPLGGNRTGPRRHIANVLIVFALSGLWHGADWKFVIWGALNGLFVVMAGLFPSGSMEETGWKMLVRRIVTFLLICCTWVFFRAGSLGDALTIFRRLLPLRPGDVLAAITAAEDLLEVVMRRYERASTLLTSNRPVDDWGKLLGDTAAVTALLDRLLHHAHVLKCGPRSWRTKVHTDLRPEDSTK